MRHPHPGAVIGPWLLVLFALPLHAQVLQLAGGDSTVAQAAGATATLYLPGSTESLSAGIAGNHLVIGATSTFDLGSWRTTIGTQNVFYSTGLLGVAEPLTGATLTRRNLTLFGGATGPVYTFPFAFGSQRPTAWVAGLSLKRMFGPLELHAVTSLAPRPSALGELRYTYRGWRLASSQAWLNDQLYWSALASGSWRGASLAASHQTVLSSAGRTIYDSLSAARPLGPLTLAGTALDSHAGFGLATSTSLNAGFLTAQASLLKAPHQNVSALTLGERLRRLTVQEYASTTGGKPSLGLGGGFTSNRLTAQVGQQLVWSAATGRFERTLAVTLQVQLATGSSNLTAQVVVLPGRALQVGGYGGAYLPVGGMATVAPGTPRSSATGRYVLSGRVVDETGKGVEGAVVRVGNVTATTDSQGNWLTRERHNQAQVLTVLVSEFDAPGTWTVVSSPTSVTPVMPVTSVVSRN